MIHQRFVSHDSPPVVRTEVLRKLDTDVKLAQQQLEACVHPAKTLDPRSFAYCADHPRESIRPSRPSCHLVYLCGREYVGYPKYPRGQCSTCPSRGSSATHSGDWDSLASFLPSYRAACAGMMSDMKKNPLGACRRPSVIVMRH
jgi:hypothetical protein